MLNQKPLNRPTFGEAVDGAGSVGLVALTLAGFLATALISIFLTRVSGSAAILWLPNALAIAMAVQSQRHVVPILLATHFVGVVLANLIYGDSSALALAFGAVNSIEVLFGCTVMRRYFKGRRPHESEEIYLLFLICAAFVSVLSGLPGGLLLHMAFEANWGSAILEWTLASWMSLVVFIPFWAWMYGGRTLGYVVTRKNVIWALGCTVMTLSLIHI